RLAIYPERPLILMLGSSLTMNGFQSEQLNELTRSTTRPILAFNFGLPGAGTIKQALLWKFLRDQGVRPDLLLLEISPRHLFDPGHVGENELEPPELRMADLAALRRYSRAGSGQLLFLWLKKRSIAMYACRLGIMNRLGMSCLLSTGSDPALRLMDTS